MFASKKTVVAVLLAASLPAFAQAPAQPVPQPEAQAPVAAVPTPLPPRPKPSREAAEIAAINERLAVMAAQLAELEMRSKMASIKSEMEKNSTVSAVDAYFVPSVAEISGIDSNIWAVLNVQGGNTQRVKKGDTVGVWRVEDIQADSVTVRKGKEVHRLSFGNATFQPAPAPASTASTQSVIQ